MGLREQKKAATRAEISRQALRLFQEQGYEATTTEQIAAAANVSPSTFFRYFPTKGEAVLVEDVFPEVFRHFMAQPEGTPLTEALRAGLRETYGRMDEAGREADRSRRELLFTVPELRMALMDRYAVGIEELCAAAAARTGRDRQDLAVRTWAGAIIGVLASVSMGIGDGGAEGSAPGASEVPDSPDAPVAPVASAAGADFAEVLDDAIALVEAGLPL